MEMLSNVRATQQQLERDVSGLNKNGFLVIRCGYFNYTDPKTGKVTAERCDQLSFLSYGSFPHRTGTLSGTNQLADSTTSPSAFVWWGQLALEKAGANATAPPGFQNPNEGVPLPLDQRPMGVNEGDFTLGRSTMILVPSNSGSSSVSPNGTAIAAFLDNPPGTPPYPLSAIDYYGNYAAAGHKLSNTPFPGETSDITQSRIDAAATSSGDIMACVQQALAVSGRTTTYSVGLPLQNSYNRFEADHFCYRRGALSSPYDGTKFGACPQYVNGYFRTVPIVMQGVSSFAVDWTDGSVYAAADATSGAATSALDLTTGTLIGKVGSTTNATLVGGTKWYGFCTPGTNPSSNVVGLVKGAGANPEILVDGSATANDPDFAGATAVQDNFVDNGSNSLRTPTSANSFGDNYTAIFSFDTPSNKWPVALRFRYHVVDPTGRLPGGRDFVQVVSLPR
jgi:hypothetical protein